MSKKKKLKSRWTVPLRCPENLTKNCAIIGQRRPDTTYLEGVGKLVPLVWLGDGELLTHVIDPDLAQVITWSTTIPPCHLQKQNI
jgi:hypothetical protein